jgi:hypothetical protein
MRTFVFVIFSLALAGCQSLTTTSQPPAVAGPPAGVRYWQEVTDQPRPMRMHFIEVDLSQTSARLEARIAPDPDGGDGPAEAKLVNPIELATEPGVIAAVNTNAFGALPDANGKRPKGWYPSMPVTIAGWARHNSINQSPPQRGFGNFWIDANGRAHVDKDAGDNALDAAAGFNIILNDGRTVGGVDKVLHPRTAIGVDQTGSKVWLLVVDGRQPGYSEGATCHELAGIFQRLGAWDALNLDGGGSSIMLMRDPNGQLKLVNRPSGFTLRPLPTMLLLRSHVSP